MTHAEYKKEVDALVVKINTAKERLWSSVKQEDFKTAATLRDQIQVNQNKLLELLNSPVPTP